MEIINEKKNIKYLLLILFLILIVVVSGTYAWLTYRSNDTAMVLTVGEINSLRVTLSPYQINTKIGANTTYEGQPYTQITAQNGSLVDKPLKVYYKIHNIDNELAIREFTYTILKSTDDGTTYNDITSTSSDNNFYGVHSGDEITILEESIPSGETYLYQVYLWVDGSENPTIISGKKQFNAELNAEIFSLPSGYQQVEYLESTGTQYIDTGIVPDYSTYEYEWDLKVKFNDNFQYMGSNGNLLIKNTNNYIGPAGTYDGVVFNTSTIYNCELYMAIGGVRTGKINGNLITGTMASQKHSIFLFALAVDGGYGYFSSARIYSSMIFKNDELIQNLIPCYRKGDEEPGLYDTVTGEFYTNANPGANAGEFVLGPSV